MYYKYFFEVQTPAPLPYVRFYSYLFRRYEMQKWMRGCTVQARHSLYCRQQVVKPKSSRDSIHKFKIWKWRSSRWLKGNRSGTSKSILSSLYPPSVHSYRPWHLLNVPPPILLLLQFTTPLHSSCRNSLVNEFLTPFILLLDVRYM